MKKGFTLVELSIVLVIIGLLIGGILVAQSMIKTTKIIRFVGQIQQYDAALANFQTKYNSLPGDSRLINPQGNGNGFVEQAYLSTDASFNAHPSANEAAIYWQHLVISGFKLPGNIQLSGTFPASGSAYFNTTVNPVDIPPADVLDEAPTDNFYSGNKQKMGGIMAIQSYGCPLPGQNCYMVGTIVKDSFMGAAALNVPEITSKAIDAKMDDGNLNSGSVRVGIVGLVITLGIQTKTM